ncbi:MAG: MBL fold metallo-hydrolase [Chloroflexota bacterium]|nr:MBL fold metallo-hydrolase [Chloroflexota bacterium]
MTTITVLAGERTIGGTQIVVEDEGARLLFDCGIAFDPAGDPFAHVRRRPGRGVADLLKLGMAPAIPGLYAQEHGEIGAGALPPSGGPLAVALSHSHLDHTHLLGFVSGEIPVYASEPAARIARVLSDTGASLAMLQRPIQALPDPGSFTVGPMNVQLLPVDHDVGGASAMLIETSDGVIAYSGDLRLHGLHPDRSLAFARAARNANARILILEGTRLSPPPEPGTALLPDRTEAEVVPCMMAALTEVPGRLGVVLLTPENGERVEALAIAAAAAGRLLVLDLEGLAFATAALGRPIAAPHAVYLPDEDAERVTGGRPQGSPLREALEAAPRSVTAAEMAADPGAFLLRLPFDRFAELLDLNPRGGVVMQANGTPLGRFDPSWASMEWWAARLDMRVVECGSSGHAAPQDLARLAEGSGAPVIMAIHSRYPELMPVPSERLLLPVRGYRYEVAGGIGHHTEGGMPPGASPTRAPPTGGRSS